ncbi:MAG: LuxR family transcriptional regulator [Rhodospirillaceae bacterium]|nr:LuxR family transcriptional regulator [Rhodospirillales bacterium]
MQQHLVDDFITGLTTVTTVDSARELFTKTLHCLDVGHYAYLGLRFRNAGPRGKPFFITTYPQPWVEHYDNNNYLQIDPVMQDAPSRSTPMHWGTREHRKQMSPRQKRFLNEAAEMGLCQGAAIPIHAAGGEFGLVSVAVDATPRQFDTMMRTHQHQLHLISLYYHAHVAEKFISNESPKVSVTTRERECLLWSALGKSSWEISEILTISEATVNFHMQNAMRKLEVYSRPHAIVKAVMMGIISP